MPYSIKDLMRFAVEKSDSEVELEDFVGSDGHAITQHLPQGLREKLLKRGGDERNGDYSRQDSALITSILSLGHSPADVYATFAASIRGKHAAERKTAHFHDYLVRTIRSAMLYLQAENGNGHSELSQKISVNFGGKKNTELDGSGKAGIVFLRGENVEVEKVRWLWKGYIPFGKITVLAGDPGMGKSTIALDLVSRITRGEFLPTGGERSPVGTCVLASAEDGPGDTIVPRLLVANADLKRIRIIHRIRLAEDEEASHLLSLPRDEMLLQQALIDTGARVLIIDPFNSFMERGTDTYKDQDVRMVLFPLEEIARRTGAAVIIVAHLNKKEDANTLYRVGGSIGFIGAARSVLAVTRTEDNIKVMYSLKSNLAKPPRALSYETRSVVQDRKEDTQWKGDGRIESSRVKWKGAVDYDPNVKDMSDEAATKTEAMEFLISVLADGEVKSDDVRAEAKRAGVNRTKLDRAKTALSIKIRKGRDGWYWSLKKDGG